MFSVSGSGKPINLIVSLTAFCFMISMLGAVVFGLRRWRANQKGKRMETFIRACILWHGEASELISLTFVVVSL